MPSSSPSSSGAQSRETLFQNVRTLVVKVGTRVLCDDAGLDESRLAHLAAGISALHERGYSVVLVTSGAVGVGMSVLGYSSRPAVLAEKQGCAAVGQILLMQRYAEQFGRHGKNVAQILLTGDDLRDERRFNSVRATVKTLLEKGVIPIVNENDTVTTEEIKVGDNDKLSADVAHFLEADLLVILSDEEGLYDKNPKTNKDARRIATVERITPDILRLAEATPGSKVSVGGMKAKLTAIRQAVEAGTPAVLARGDGADLVDIVTGKDAGTLFLPSKRIDRRRRWLAFVTKPKGMLYLDAGAVSALRDQGAAKRGSVLAAGVRRVKGDFKAGDFVEVCDLDGEIVGRGRTSYASDEVEKIRGRKSSEIAALLGRPGPAHVVHRDKLAVY
jgi:glutamate 5-kinase